MTKPFRGNPKITTNWSHRNRKLFRKKETKNAYYDIKHEDNKINIIFREEKKRLGGSAEKERNWFGYLDFETDSNFAADLKMFLNNFVGEVSPEVKQEALEAALDDIDKVFGDYPDDNIEAVKERFKAVRRALLRGKEE
jgi:hypothetical protein